MPPITSRKSWRSPKSIQCVTVTAAIQRATEYGAFTARHVRRICESESALALIPPSPQVQT